MNLDKLKFEKELPKIKVIDITTSKQLIERNFKLNKIRQIDNHYRILRKEEKQVELSSDEFNELLDKTNAELDSILSNVYLKVSALKSINFEIDNY